MSIRRGIHLEIQFATVHDGLVADESLIKIISIQLRALNVGLLRAVVFGGDGKGLSVRKT